MNFLQRRIERVMFGARMLKQASAAFASVVLGGLIGLATAHAEVVALDPVRSVPAFHVVELGTYIDLATALQSADRSTACSKLAIVRATIKPLAAYSSKRAQEGSWGASVLRVRLAAKLATAGLEELRRTCAASADAWQPNNAALKILGDAALVFRSIDADARLWVK